MVELKTIRLEDEIKLEYGKGLTKDKRVEGPFNVYGSNGVVGTHNEAIFQGPGIIVGRKGTVGSIVFSENDFFAIDTSYVLKLKEPKDSIKFWYYYLQTLDLEQMNSHSAVPGLNREAVYKKEVSIICDYKYRKEVATTLSCLDDKIELNNCINKSLEEMAQAVFKSWFVDFEPFQDGEFEDSDLGRIPKGWINKSLYDFAEYINGTSFKKDEYAASGYPIIKIVEIKNGVSSATQFYNGSKDLKYYIKTGDILFSWSGNPQTSIDTFIWVGGDAILNQHIFKIGIVNNDYSYIYLLLKHFKTEFTSIASRKQTTGLGHVTVKDLKRMKFPYNSEVVNEFCSIIDPIIDMYVENLIENEKLRDIRETLLPKLMSGEIRIPIEEVN